MPALILTVIVLRIYSTITDHTWLAGRGSFSDGEGEIEAQRRLQSFLSLMDLRGSEADPLATEWSHTETISNSLTQSLLFFFLFSDRFPPHSQKWTPKCACCPPRSLYTSSIFWSLAAVICSHSTSRASVRLGTDVGRWGLVLSRCCISSEMCWALCGFFHNKLGKTFCYGPH